jgi:hypothetical protein
MRSSHDLISSINSDEERRFVESYRFMEEQKIKKVFGPDHWQDLKLALENECQNIRRSSSAQFDLVPDGIYDATLVNQRSGASLHLRYETDVPCIRVTLGEKTGYLHFRLNPNGSCQITDRGTPIDVQRLASNLIGRITR